MTVVSNMWERNLKEKLVRDVRLARTRKRRNKYVDKCSLDTQKLIINKDDN